jgi:hypothetical protein
VALVLPTGPGGSDQSAGTGGRGSGHGGTGAPVGPGMDTARDGLSGMVNALVGAAVDGAGQVIRPEAAAVVATAFGFPMVLALLVLVFLVLQPRLDNRDPKLHNAPHTFTDTLIGFEDDVR